MKKTGWLGAAMALLSLLGCDPARIAELQVGVSTEADVRAKFGPPEYVWEGQHGARIFEYNRQPAGHVNYMIELDALGRVSRVEQVLTPANFAQVLPGQPMEAVRKRLGKPAKVTPYSLKGEVHYDWRYLEPPNTSMLFTVVFSPDYYVLRTETLRDPEADGNRR